MKSEKEEARRVDRLIVALDLVKINEWSNYYFFSFCYCTHYFSFGLNICIVVYKPILLKF